MRRWPCRDACELAAGYPDNSQPNTSFPILMRTSPTSKIPAEPLSSEPRPTITAGIIVSGRHGTVGKRRVSSLPKDGEAGRRVGGSVISEGVDWGGRSRSTQAKDAWNRGRSEYSFWWNESKVGAKVSESARNCATIPVLRNTGAHAQKKVTYLFVARANLQAKKGPRALVIREVRKGHKRCRESKTMGI